MAAKKKRKSPKGKKRKKSKSKKSANRKGHVPDWVLAKRARKLNSLLSRRKIDINMPSQ